MGKIANETTIANEKIANETNIANDPVIANETNIASDQIANDSKANEYLPITRQRRARCERTPLGAFDAFFCEK